MAVYEKYNNLAWSFLEEIDLEGFRATVWEIYSRYRLPLIVYEKFDKILSKCNIRGGII
jgi:hypothetical protein